MNKEKTTLKMKIEYPGPELTEAQEEELKAKLESVMVLFFPESIATGTLVSQLKNKGPRPRPK
jgi:hypothetical protein